MQLKNSQIKYSMKMKRLRFIVFYLIVSFCFFSENDGVFVSYYVICKVKKEVDKNNKTFK